MSDMTELELPSFQAGPATLVTAQSFLIDRFVPDCEVVALPAKEVSGGVLRYGLGTYSAQAAPGADRLKARLRRPRERQIETGLVIDLRQRSPQNFAHFLNNHLPLVFFLSETLGCDWSELVLVLPEDTPGYIRAAADCFGFQTLCSDARISGPGILFEVTPWTALRPVRAGWARTPKVFSALDALAAKSSGPLPRKVFISRRKTRALGNATEVEGFLTDRGFVTIFPEDLSVPDQIRLFREAEDIVAIHGAALAPLLYVPTDAPLRRLIELMPCGHMTDVYRVMTEQIGCSWIGVRGRIKPEYIKPAYNLGSAFKAFSLDEFEVDLVALARAFDLV